MNEIENGKLQLTPAVKKKLEKLDFDTLHIIGYTHGSTKISKEVSDYIKKLADNFPLPDGDYSDATKKVARQQSASRGNPGRVTRIIKDFEKFMGIDRWLGYDYEYELAVVSRVPLKDLEWMLSYYPRGNENQKRWIADKKLRSAVEKRIAELKR